MLSKLLSSKRRQSERSSFFPTGITTQSYAVTFLCDDSTLWKRFFSEFTWAMLLITRVHWPSSIFLMTDPSGCWMLGKNPRWSIGLQLCANAVSTEARTLVSVFLVCHFMCLLWTHRDTKIQSWMFGPRGKCFHCWPANPLNFSTAGLLHRTPVHFAEGTLRNFCISYVYIYIYTHVYEKVSWLVRPS